MLPLPTATSWLALPSYQGIDLLKTRLWTEFMGTFCTCSVISQPNQSVLNDLAKKWSYVLRCSSLAYGVLALWFWGNWGFSGSIKAPSEDYWEGDLEGWPYRLLHQVSD